MQEEVIWINTPCRGSSYFWGKGQPSLTCISRTYQQRTQLNQVTSSFLRITFKCFFFLHIFTQRSANGSHNTETEIKNVKPMISADNHQAVFQSNTMVIKSLISQGNHWLCNVAFTNWMTSRENITCQSTKKYTKKTRDTHNHRKNSFSSIDNLLTIQINISIIHNRRRLGQRKNELKNE